MSAVQKSLVIEVDLHYTQADSKARLKESRQHEIGKPLVAWCELHRRKQVEEPTDQERRDRRDGAPLWSIDQKASCRQPPRHQHGRPSTRKAENAWKCAAAAKNPSSRSNEPEENDENEILEFFA